VTQPAIHEAFDHARVERCKALTSKWLPKIERAVRKAKRDLDLAVGGDAQIDEQVECMRTTLWLCDAVTAAFGPGKVSADVELQVLRVALVEMATALGEGLAVGRELSRLARVGVAPHDGHLVTAELFLANVEGAIKRLGMVVPEARR